MRRSFILLSALFMLFYGGTGARAQSTEEASPVPFTISSLKTPFALAGSFEGEYLVRDNSIEITIRSAYIYLRKYGTYEGRRELSFINIGLVSRNETGRWKVISHGFAIPVGEVMKPGDHYVAAEKMRFSIPKDSSLDLTKCWLVVEMGELALDSSDEDKVGYAFAHSSRDIFTPVLARAAQK